MSDARAYRATCPDGRELWLVSGGRGGAGERLAPRGAVVVYEAELELLRPLEPAMLTAVIEAKAVFGLGTIVVEEADRAERSPGPSAPASAPKETRWHRRS